MKALSFGEVLWDVIDNVEHLGGAPFNLAAHLAQLGCESYAITRIGDDKRGRKISEEAARLGLKNDFIQIDPSHPTSWVDVELTGEGVPSYIIHENVAWDFIRATEEMMEKLRGRHFDVFCFGTLSQRSSASRQSLYRLLDVQCARNVFCDINLRQDYYSHEIISKSLDYANIVKLNDEEVEQLSLMLFRRNLLDYDFAGLLQARYDVETVCITRGANGSTIYHPKGVEETPGIEVEVADTVGAGDAYGAGFLKKFCEGAPMSEGASFANQIGAFVASQSGAIPPYNDEIRNSI